MPYVALPLCAAGAVMTTLEMCWTDGVNLLALFT